MTRELGIGYSTLRRLLKREIDEEALGFIQDEDEIYLGIDEHSFRHQELVHTITEVKQRKVLGILRDDRLATLKKFLTKVPWIKVKEVCIDMKDGLRKAVEVVFPLAWVVFDPFHVIADANKRMDEARRIEQDVYEKKKVQIPKKIFLGGQGKAHRGEKTEGGCTSGKVPWAEGILLGKGEDKGALSAAKSRRGNQTAGEYNLQP